MYVYIYFGRVKINKQYKPWKTVFWYKVGISRSYSMVEIGTSYKAVVGKNKLVASCFAGSFGFAYKAFYGKVACFV